MEVDSNHSVADQLVLRKPVFNLRIPDTALSASVYPMGDAAPISNNLRMFGKVSLREKCPNKELFLVRIFLYSDWIQENTDQI